MLSDEKVVFFVFFNPSKARERNSRSPEPESVTSMRITGCEMLISQGIQKNLNFTLRLSGYFFDRCGIKSLCPVPWWSQRIQVEVI